MYIHKYLHQSLKIAWNLFAVDEACTHFLNKAEIFRKISIKDKESKNWKQKPVFKSAEQF